MTTFLCTNRGHLISHEYPHREIPLYRDRTNPKTTISPYWGTGPEWWPFLPCPSTKSPPVSFDEFTNWGVSLSDDIIITGAEMVVAVFFGILVTEDCCGFSFRIGGEIL